MTIYERFGESAVAVLLDGLYVRAVADPLLMPFLDGIDIPRLKQQQYTFISQAIGGPHVYSGPPLPVAHARLNIEDRHFTAFIQHLESALREDLNSPDDMTAEILGRVNALRPVILNSPNSTD